MALTPVTLGSQIGLAIPPDTSPGHDTRHLQIDTGLTDLTDRVNSILAGTTGAAFLGNAQEFTKTQTLRPTTASAAAAIAKGLASQTGNLLEAQDSSGAVLARIGSSGTIYGPIIAAPQYDGTASAGTYLTLGATSAVMRGRVAGSNTFAVQGAPSQTATLLEAQTSGGSVVASISAAGAVLGSSLISSSGAIDHSSLAGTQMLLTNTSAFYLGRLPAQTVVVVRGAASQTSDLQAWQTVGPTTTVGKINVRGEYEGTIVGNPTTDALGGGGGIVLRSPNGTRWRVTVTNLGGMSIVAA